MTTRILSTLSLSLLFVWMPYTQSMEGQWKITRQQAKKLKKQESRIKHLKNFGVESYIEKYNVKCLSKDFPKISVEDLANAKKLKPRPTPLKEQNPRDYIHELIRTNNAPEDISRRLEQLEESEADRAKKDLTIRKNVYKGIIRIANKHTKEQAAQDLSQSVMMAEHLEVSQVVPVEKTTDKKLGWGTKLKDWYYGHKNISAELTQAIDLSAAAQQKRIDKAIDYCAKNGMISDLTKIYQSLKVLDYKLVDSTINTRALKAFASAKNARCAALANLIAQEAITLDTGIKALLAQLDSTNTKLLEHVQDIQILNEEQKLVHASGMLEQNEYDDTFVSHEEHDIYESIHMTQAIKVLRELAFGLDYMKNDKSCLPALHIENKK